MMIAFTFSGLWWNSVDYLTSHWFPLALLTATIGYVVLRAGLELLDYLLRRQHAQAQRQAQAAVAAELEQMARERRIFDAVARKGGR